MYGQVVDVLATTRFASAKTNQYRGGTTEDRKQHIRKINLNKFRVLLNRYIRETDNNMYVFIGY